MSHSDVALFNIQLGDELTQNVKPILHQVRHALEKLLDCGETSIIDLRSIPLAPGEEQTIIDTLGCGEVQASLDSMGASEIYETQYAGVWLISHYNEDHTLVSRFIEITELPMILESQHEDMVHALERLGDELTTDNMASHVETDT